MPSIPHTSVRLSRSLRLAACIIAPLIVPVHGAVIVQELFDAIAGPPPGTNASLNGKGDTATSVGMTGTWAATNGIFTASNFNAGAAASLPGLPSNAGQTGGVWNNTGSYTTNIYATRQLATTIDFSTTQTIYFSVILDNAGDTSMGIGLASGSSAASEFVGAGLTWNDARSLSTGLLDSGNATYTAYGTLGADSGVYGIRSHEAQGSINGSALLVGRISISDVGMDQIDVVRYGGSSTIAADPSLVTWSASSSFTTSMQASQVLLWMNGSGQGQVDAVRFGTDWQSVTGVPEPSVMAFGLMGILAIFRRRRLV